MNYILALCCGIIVAVMNVFNGQLSVGFSVYLSTVIIHVVGLITFILVMKVKREAISFRNHVPIYYYLGGVIGVFTVVLSSLSITFVGSALLTALGLIGQIITSIVLQQKGWLATQKKSLNIKQCLGLLIIILGIGVML